MAGRRPPDVRAFEELARVVASGPFDPDALIDRICREVQSSFRLARVDFVRPDALAARHPLVERACAERRAVTDGARVAAPLLSRNVCLGFVIGDCAGGELELDEAELHLLTALTAVGAVFVEKSGAHRGLERSLDERTNFVSLASHELRTPIAVVHGVVSTLHLRGAALAPDQLRELHATAYVQTSRLAELTEQLLDLTRLESGVVAQRRERVRLRRLVDDLLVRTVPERLGDVAVEIEPGLELETDPDGLERVLANLIVNAFRYGAPPVSVRAEGSRVVVEDRGEGIDPALVPRLFERFSRGGSDRTGAGLGLAIARSYAEALGGTLVYERARPRGSRFALALPGVVARMEV